MSKVKSQPQPEGFIPNRWCPKCGGNLHVEYSMALDRYEVKCIMCSRMVK